MFTFGPASRGGVDPFLVGRVLLLHGDGTNGSTTITDSSPTPATMTASGDAKISTAQSKFGGASMIFDGVTDYITSNRPNNIGAGKFTIQAWLYATSRGLAWMSSSPPAGANPIFWSRTLSDGTLQFFMTNSGGSFVGLDSGSLKVAASTWTHVAVTRDAANRVDVWVNGVSGGNVTAATDVSGGGNYCIGANEQGGQSYFEGHIDELMVNEGVCLYTGTFTPQSSPYS